MAGGLGWARKTHSPLVYSHADGATALGPSHRGEITDAELVLERAAARLVARSVAAPTTTFFFKVYVKKCIAQKPTCNDCIERASTMAPVSAPAPGRAPAPRAPRAPAPSIIPNHVVTGLIVSLPRGSFCGIAERPRRSRSRAGAAEEGSLSARITSSICVERGSSLNASQKGDVRSLRCSMAPMCAQALQ